jgi:hypothetical protein
VTGNRVSLRRIDLVKAWSPQVYERDTYSCALERVESMSSQRISGLVLEVLSGSTCRLRT